MNDLTVPPYEQGVTRLFALSMSANEAKQVKADPQIQATLLGVTHVQTKGVEVFSVADLGDLGLVGYLREGIDAQAEDLAHDGAKLAALDGWVMMVHSSAFDTGGVVLTPLPQLTLIGRYAQHAIEAAPVDMPSDSAQPYSGIPTMLPPPVPPARNGGAVLVVALIGLTALLLWWALA